MSVHATAWAWDRPVSGNAKLVLLALADECRGHDGLCWPGLKRVAGMTGIEQRSVRRQLEVLEAKGLLVREERRRPDGSQTSNLIRLNLSTPPDAGVLPSPDAGVLPRAVEQEPEQISSPKSPSREHPEFSEWVGHHHEVTGSTVPKAGSVGRRKLAAMFGARREEGFELAELKLATLGAWHDDWRRANGHTGHESVLRPTKIGKLVDAGRAYQAKLDAGGTDWTQFDD